MTSLGAANSSSAYGLDHPCRAIIPLSTPSTVDKPTSTHRFLVGTCALRSNKLHLLEYHEGNNLLECIAVWSHDPEVVALSSNCSIEGEATVPMFASVFAANDKLTSGKNEVKVFVLQGDDETKLAQQHHIPIHANSVTFENSSSSSGSLMITGDNTISFVSLSASTTPAHTIQVDSPHVISAATRDVHHKDLVAVAYGPTLSIADRRSSSGANKNGQVNVIAAKAHQGATVKALDYNPNQMYQLCTAGDDGSMKVWDLRKVGRGGGSGTETQATTVPFFSQRIHDHSVQHLSFNLSHDQLMLSSGSDHTLKLWHWNAFSSANPTLSSPTGTQPSSGSLMTGSSSSSGLFSDLDVVTTVDKNGKIPKNGLLSQLSDFSESVYGACWSANSPWVFAGCSYSGRVLVGKVPGSVQRDIMLHGEE